MPIHETILSAVGKTPLVRLNRVVGLNSATVYAKCEFLNPAGSVKDRMAVHILKRAEERGMLKPGSTIVEATSGNTGLGVAMVAAVKGYRAIFSMPDKMSIEKRNMLRAFGAEVRITPTNVAPDSPESYYEVAKRIARETPNSFLVNQYYNMDNPEAHYLSTGPEIWSDTEGKIDVLVAGASTGGTVSGTGKYLKEQAALRGGDVKIVCPDPEGSIYFEKFYKIEGAEPHQYKVEGVGNDHLVGCVDFAIIDEMRKVSDKQSFTTARRLAREEGLFVGGTSGTNAHVALELANELGAGKIIVVILPDSGSRYVSKFYNDTWMKDFSYI